jgi:hypothetical protein
MDRLHPLAKRCSLLGFGLTLLLTAALQAQDARDTSKPSSETSRAWYILGQTDTAGLLNGLPQRLFQATSDERRSSTVWKGVDNGATLKLRIETEGNVEGQILVGFFKDVNWEAAEPAQVRSFPGPGEYTVERMIPGAVKRPARMCASPTIIS